MGKLTNREYSSVRKNSNVTKSVRMEFPMQDRDYAYIEMEDSAGIKIRFEFPARKTERDLGIEHEVKDILSGELRNSLRKNAG